MAARGLIPGLLLVLVFMVAACAPQAGLTPTVTSEPVPPNGVWQAEVTGDDLIRMGVAKANVPDWAGVYTRTFQDGVFTTSWKLTEGPGSPR